MSPLTPNEVLRKDAQRERILRRVNRAFARSCHDGYYPAAIIEKNPHNRIPMGWVIAGAFMLLIVVSAIKECMS